MGILDPAIVLASTGYVYARALGQRQARFRHGHPFR